MANPTLEFQTLHPSTDSYWRAIVLFGRNVASYKFALAEALLHRQASTGDLVTLEELAAPFAAAVRRHLRDNDKQGTSGSSRFLDACRAANAGELSDEALHAKTVSLGFNNVIDAFHIVDGKETPERFFLDERASARGLRLTDNAYKLLESPQLPNLVEEVESRWRLVEVSWDLQLPRSVLAVTFDDTTGGLVVPRRRRAITSARGALNGYQKGHCFYCFRSISVAAGDEQVCEVDHVFPWSTGAAVAGAPVDGLWNLVLACRDCNSWQSKSDQPPHARYVERLHRRNEYLIESEPPLRPTIVGQMGTTPEARAQTLLAAFAEVTVNGARSVWEADEAGEPVF